MARQKTTTQQPTGERSARGTRPRQRNSGLHREITGTLALLTDEEDFARMRRYRTFPFDTHTAYLAEADRCLQQRAAQGRHTTLTLFDPEEYEEFCAESGLEADAPDSRARFTAHLQSRGPAIPYEGRPLSELLPHLVDAAVRQATFAYASELLGDAGDCADCGESLGRAAFDHAAHLLVAVLQVAGPGDHHLVCSTSAPSGTLLADLDVTVTPDGAFRLEETDALDLTTVLASALATEAASGLVARTARAGEPDSVRGWRLREATLHPLSAAEVFDAYCTDTATGEPIPPEPGVDYRAAPALDLFHPGRPHGHGGRSD